MNGLALMGVGAARGTAAAFSPSSVSGLVAWYDAQAIAGKSDGDALSSWADGSGLAHDLSQATGANQPLYKTAILNGHPIVRFDGVNDIMGTAAFTLNQPSTRFLKLKLRTTAGQNAMDGNTGVSQLLQFSGFTYVYAGTFLTNNTAFDTSWHTYECVYNGASSRLRIDNGTATNGNAGSSNAGGVTVGAAVGGSAPLDGDVAELIVYNTTLSSTDRDNVVQYLTDHWA